MAGTDGYRCSWRFAGRARDELCQLDEDGRGWLMGAMKEYEKGLLPRKDLKPVTVGIKEITVNRAGTWYRCLFFHPRPFIAVALLAYQKKSNKLPPRHLQTAKARMREWESGHPGGGG